MAKKVRCPGCGAKNDVGQHRCRVCTAVIDPSATEGLPKGLAKQRKLDERLAAAADKRKQRAPGSAEPDPFGGATDLGPFGGTAPDDTAGFGPMPAAATPPMAPVPTEPVATEPLATEPLAPAAELPADAIVIDAAPRHLADVTAPVEPEPAGEADSWDAVGGIEIDVVSRNATAPPPLEYEGSFDPDDLVIDPPR
jgi:hypothetical protein